MHRPTIEEIDQAISYLKSVDLNAVDYGDVKKRTDTLVSFGIAANLIPKGQQSIYRGRVVDSINSIHKRVRNISYPPKSKGPITYNRASTNKYQIFYGAVHGNIALQQLGALTTMIEVGSIMDDDNTADLEYVTVGRWSIERTLPIAVVGIHSTLAEAHPSVPDMKSGYLELIENDPQFHQTYLKIQQFVSSEFSKKVSKNNTHEYKISAAYGEGIFELGFAALIFPSVKAEGKVFNIALSKWAVAKFLKPKVAAVVQLKKIAQQEISVGIFLQSPIIHKWGKFEWKDPPSIGRILSPYQENQLLKSVYEKSGIFGPAKN
jgi:hypothetical protein